MFPFIGWSVGMLFIGFMFGTIRKDDYMYKVNRSQQERGDYWFDKYMAEVRDDWDEPDLERIL